jgi:hypothetical protein
LKRILTRAPVIGLHATLRGAPDLLDCAGWMVSITIGGRSVAGCVPAPGSLVALDGSHVGCMVCGEACAAALSAAVSSERHRFVMH